MPARLQLQPVSTHLAGGPCQAHSQDVQWLPMHVACRLVHSADLLPAHLEGGWAPVLARLIGEHLPGGLAGCAHVAQRARRHGPCSRPIACWPPLHVETRCWSPPWPTLLAESGAGLPAPELAASAALLFTQPPGAGVPHPCGLPPSGRPPPARAGEPLDASTSILLVYFEATAPEGGAAPPLPDEPGMLATYELFLEQRGEGAYKVRGARCGAPSPPPRALGCFAPQAYSRTHAHPPPRAHTRA